MKLISCHIENFGKLHDCSMEFADGVNVLCKENGWGKSTFAAFIRAMFYGLDGDRKHKIEENERKRYKPWQGGVFGGQLVFETGDKRYRISRIFHDKEANDEFELREADTNLVSGDYSARIGEELFKIGRESFSQTIFIGQSECDTCVTDDMNAKIGNITDHTNDMNHFDSVNATLKDMINQMSPSRKSGSIAKRKNEIAELERKVKDGLEISKSMDYYREMLLQEQEQYAAKKTQMQENTVMQRKVSVIQETLAKKEEWCRLKKAMEEKNRVVAAQKEKFPGEIPEEKELQEALAWSDEYGKAAERVRLTELSEAERRELVALDDLFSAGIPDEGDLRDRIEKATQYVQIKQEQSAEQLSEHERKRLEQLEESFGQDAEPVSLMVGKWNERNHRNTKLSSAQNTLSVQRMAARTQTTQKSGISVLAIAGIAVVLCGILMLVSQLWIPGMGMIVIGLVLVVVGMLSGRKQEEQQDNTIMPEMSELERNIQEDTAFIKQTDKEVRDYLVHHGKEFKEDTVFALLHEITEESVEYHTLKEKSIRASSSTTKKELEELEEDLKVFLAPYQLGTSKMRFLEDLYVLKNKSEQYLVLDSKEQKNQEAKEAFTVLEGKIDAFLKKIGYAKEENIRQQLSEIKEMLQQYHNAENNREETVRTLAQFEDSYDVSAFEREEMEEHLPSLEEINDAIASLTTEMESGHKIITDYNKTLEELQRQYDEWQDYGMRLEQLQELQRQEQKKLQYLKKVQEKLCEAKEAITSKYSAPILEAFGRYYSMITGQDAEGFHIDANIAITVDEFGKQRQINTLSTGCRDLISICLRVAFVDAMYQEEVPMLVLDDPFTHLDDEKIRDARIFMEYVAKRYQIIYFTCSNTRNIER